MDDDIKQMLIKYEGLKLKPYRDSMGKLTIGIGRNLDDDGISDDEALFLLTNDIHRCELQLKSYPWYIFQPPIVQKALINMCFNLGIDKLLGFKNMIAALNDKDYTRASLEALDSKWAIEVGRRAKDIALMIREGNHDIAAGTNNAH